MERSHRANKGAYLITGLLRASQRRKPRISYYHFMKKLIAIISSSVAFASLCCLSSVVIVALWLGSVSFAASLSDTFYGEYKWYFRAFGLICLIVGLVWYFRSEGICTLDRAKREQKKIINTILITLFAGIAGYIFFLYVVVHYLGVWQGIWK